MPYAFRPYEATLADLSSRPFQEVAPPRWYWSKDTKCPHLLVMRLPEILANNRSAEGELNAAFKVVVIESDAEVAEARHLIAKPLEVSDYAVSLLGNIDVIAGRRSRMPHPNGCAPMLLTYHSDAPEWPSFVVTSMPPHLAGPGLQRGRWAYDAFSTKKGPFGTCTDSPG